MSLMKRLTLGLGIIALGVCLAWPFRRPAPPEATLVADTADSQLSLGEGVSLQMPGQTMTAPLASKPPAPWTAEDKPASDETGSDTTDVATESTQTIPPALPDQYHPLFKPPLAGDGSGRVVLPAGPQVPRKPPKKHTIHDGDTLESLAVRYLGDARRAGDILEANRGVLKDPDLLPIGVVITIPTDAPPAARTSETAADDTPTLVPLPTDAFRRGQ